MESVDPVLPSLPHLRENVWWSLPPKCYSNYLPENREQFHVSYFRPSPHSHQRCHQLVANGVRLIGRPCTYNLFANRLPPIPASRCRQIPVSISSLSLPITPIPQATRRRQFARASFPTRR